ncbi:unnamed protein product [Choristocarpus tenellus]
MNRREMTNEETPLISMSTWKRDGDPSKCSSHGKSDSLCCCGTKTPFYRGSRTPIKNVDLLNIYSLPSLAILMSYFCVGVVLQLLSTPVAYYLIDNLGASSGVYTTYYVLTTLPWSFKVLYGLLSDCVPLWGLKRKPYFVIGWLIHILANLCLALVGTPGVQLTIALSFFSACGYLLSDVMTDAIVVERTKLEKGRQLGNIQASGYIARFVGSALGATAGAVLYDDSSWGWGLSISQLFWMNGLIPLFAVLPFTPFLYEERRPSGDPLKKHLLEIWTLSKKLAVWRPMAFVYIYNAMLIPNAAWTNYLVETLSFSEFEIGVINIGAQVFSWMGLVMYKWCMTNMNWRDVYILTTIVGAIFSTTQLMLLFRINKSLGIPDVVFATGDEGAVDFAIALQFLPLTRMYAVMCPMGTEGTSYALLTTVSNLAEGVAYSIGDMLTELGGSWNVSNSVLIAGDISGMWRLTLLTSLIQVVPLGLIKLLPSSMQQQKAWQESSDSNKWGGSIFLAVTMGSILFTLGQGIWELVYGS